MERSDKTFPAVFPLQRVLYFSSIRTLTSGIVHIIADHRQTLSQIRFLIAGNRHFHLQLSFKCFPMICQCCRNRQQASLFPALPLNPQFNVISMSFSGSSSAIPGRQQQDQQYQYYSPDMFLISVSPLSVATEAIQKIPFRQDHFSPVRLRHEALRSDER